MLAQQIEVRGTEAQQLRSQKLRPPALLLESIAGRFHDLSEWPPRSEDIPVRRTFIDFGSLARYADTPPDSPQHSMSTAPARLGLSMQGAFDSLKADAAETASTTSSTRHTHVPADTPLGSSRSSSAQVSIFNASLDTERGVKNDFVPSVASETPRSPSPSIGEAPQPLCLGESLVAWPSGENALWSLQDCRRPISIASELGGAAEGDSDFTEDGESSDDDQEVCPIYSESAELPSRGSADHSAGNCKRCCFFPKGRCSNGANCQYCHFAHEKRKGFKAKKKKLRRRLRKHRKNPQQGDASYRSLPLQSSLQQILGGSMWIQPPPKPSRLIVHDLQFVPSAVLPGHSSPAKVFQRTVGFY